MLISDEQLKKILLHTGLINEQGLAEIEEYAKNSSSSFSDALIQKDIISDENLGLLIADSLHYPFISLSKITIPDEIFHLVPENVARRKKVIPFAKDNQGLHLAMTDPANVEIQQMIARKTGLSVIPHITTEREVSNALRIYRKDLKKTFEELLREEIGSTDLSKVTDDAPIEKIVNLLIEFAYQDRTSDIHIEPQEKESLVRFRIDGILHDMLTLPKYFHERIIARIKILSRLRTDEHQAPQDGKMRMKLEEENLDIRVSIIPIVDGEKTVLRLLASHYQQFSLADLGMNPQDLKKVTGSYNKSYGMILSTGPTGSGKSTSIYAILKVLNTREKNITTIEDPVEYRMPGVNQIQANAKADLTFASGLRSILRQDPNIVFVGEIRDSETAGIAVNAALTGHLVLSTLHTNDAATALPRLIDMNIEPFLVASTVNIIIGQRLIRKICDMCKTSLDITFEDLTKNFPVEMVKKHFGDGHQIRIYQGKGCKICHNTGYSGRIGIYEVLEVTKEIKKLISEKHDSDVILKAAIQEGMNTMLDDGLEKVKRGITSIEEVLRVTKVESL